MKTQTIEYQIKPETTVREWKSIHAGFVSRAMLKLTGGRFGRDFYVKLSEKAIPSRRVYFQRGDSRLAFVDYGRIELEKFHQPGLPSHFNCRCVISITEPEQEKS